MSSEKKDGISLESTGIISQSALKARRPGILGIFQLERITGNRRRGANGAKRPSFKGIKSK